MTGLILVSPSSSSLKFLSNYGLDEVISPSLDIAESVTWTPRLSSSLLDGPESGYSLKDDDFSRNNILGNVDTSVDSCITERFKDIDNNDRSNSRSQQVAVYTVPALPEAQSIILRSTDGTALVQLVPGGSSLSSTTSDFVPAGALAPAGESGSPPSSSGTSNTAYYAPVQPLNPNSCVDDRDSGLENLNIRNGSTRWVVQHPEKTKQKHHDSATDAVVPFRELESCQLPVEGRRININAGDIVDQDEPEETQNLIHRPQGNVRFAVQAALAQSARREQKQAFVEGGGGALVRSGSGGWGRGGYKSATRAYIERAESWFGQDVLIESLNQMFEEQGTKSRKRKQQRLLGQLQTPISLPAPPPWSRSLPATQAMATVLNSPPKRAHSPDAIGCDKRRRSEQTSSAVSTDGDGVCDREEDGGELEEESNNEPYNLETYALLLQKLIKGKSTMSSGEIQQIQTFVSSWISEQITTDSDYESTIYQSILHIAKSSKGEFGLETNEEDKLRRIAKRVVSKR